ncbi:DUF3563 family protein [Actimicrobium sp. CCC2.4]|uniref:DUF3563 family protein n=1 Tax=Actimicrobium sp. CCC2.4 TaxID=3048606 RepID=UPI002AC95759|nr:DUF3563 family protein [Actimicrobium sp. CCC2.4]MEB0135620.1 DUF3563 family protein [Actimicrobium sp. CCC2.4]WPX33818.1 DUF3563 family protein [Actimicrobium sp. CCC2.4]
MTTLQHTPHAANFGRSVIDSISALGHAAGESIVSRTMAALNALSESFDARQRALQDDYLAQSTSIADLERRMHDLERRDGQPKLNMMTGMH